MATKVAPRPSATTWLLASLLVLVAAGLRAPALGTGSLWGDEGYTVRPPSGTDWDIPAAMPFSTYSLHYHLLQGWMYYAGGSEYAVRFPSFLAGVALTAATFVVGRRIGGGAVGAAAALLAAVSPALIYHAQTARSYALAAALMAVHVYALLRVWDEPRRMRWWTLAVAALFAASTAHLWTLTALPATLLVLALSAWRARRWVPLGVATLGLALGLWPWASRSLVSTLEGYAVRGGEVYAPATFAGVVRDGLLLADYTHFRAVEGDAVALAAGLALVVGGATLACRFGPRVGLVVALALLPLATSYLVHLRAPYFAGRYVIFLCPSLYALAAGGLAHRRPALAVLLAVPWLLVLASVVPRAVQQAFPTNVERLDLLAEELRVRGRPGDVLISNSGYRQTNLDYYLQEVDLPVEVLPLEGIVREDVRRRVGTLADRYDRLWVVFFSAPPDNPTHEIERRLSAAFARVSRHAYGTTSLSLYVRASDETSCLPGEPVLFGDALALVACSRASDLSAQPGESVVVRLGWRLRRSGDFGLSLRLVDGRGQVWAQEDARPRNGMVSTLEWPTTGDLVEARGLSVPWGTPSGRYRLELVAYDATTGAGLGVRDQGRPGPAPSWTVGTVSVEPADAPPPLDLLPLQRQLRRTMGAVELLGGSWSARVTAGQEVALDLFWRAVGRVAPADAVEVRLVDGRGRAWGVGRGPLIGDEGPSWEAGEVRRQQARLRVRPGTPPGEYRLQVEAIAPSAMDEARVDLGRVVVESRPRSYAAPESQHPVGASFEEGIELLGYDLLGAREGDSSAFRPQPGDAVEVELHWRASESLGEEGVETSYTVFVQVIDAAGRLVAQHDGLPAGGAAPTTTWAPGEVVRDRHALALPPDLPAGRYALIAGLYDASTLRRLRTATADHVVLGYLAVGGPAQGLSGSGAAALDRPGEGAYHPIKPRSEVLHAAGQLSAAR